MLNDPQVYLCKNCNKETIHVRPAPLMIPSLENLDDQMICNTCDNGVRPVKNKLRKPPIIRVFGDKSFEEIKSELAYEEF